MVTNVFDLLKAARYLNHLGQVILASFVVKSVYK